MDSNTDELASRIMACAEISESGLSLYSEVDGYIYDIQRDCEDDDWYIRVNPAEHGFDYDGWWSDSEEKTLEEAVREAIYGAGILDDEGAEHVDSERSLG